MGRAELVLALKQKGKAETEAIWAQAQAEVEQYRRQRQQEVGRQEVQSGREAARSAEQECRRIDARVARTARAVRLQALVELEGRLRKIASEELFRIDPLVRRQCLETLAAELPGAGWEKIVVSPDDLGAAKKIYPECMFETADSLAGGLIGETATERIRVDNSLTQRLNKLWPELVGRMLAELEGHVKEAE